MNHTLKDALDFGSFNYRHSLYSYIIRVLLFFIPGLIISYFLDKSIKYLQESNTLKFENKRLNHIFYFSLEFIILICILYFIDVTIYKYESEFQKTIPGLFFLTFFSMSESNLKYNFNKMLNL
jgi:C4-dicarboxylate transporter